MRIPLKNVFLGSTLLLSGIVLSSCENETLDTDTLTIEQASQNQEWEKISYNGKTIDVQKEGNFYLWGDVLIPVNTASKISDSDQTASSSLEGTNTQNQSIVSESNRIWPNNTIPYFFDPISYDPTSFRSTLKARAAIHHWELFTPIDFVETNGEADSDLLIFQGTGCNATVGFNSTGKHSNAVSIGDSCGIDEAIHEFGHSAGLFHEQNRRDRDDFVTVNFDNIQERFHFAYEKNEDKGDTALEFTPFDFESIMMYGSDTFSIGDGARTMVKINGSTVDRNEILSKYDVIGIESLYNQGSPKKIAISSLINSGDYVSSENGRKDITSTREAIGKWEKFNIFSFGGGEISLQASNGKFLSINEATGGLKFSSSRVGANEKFIATYNTAINEKFYYTISHNNNPMFADGITGELKIDNSGGGGQDELFALEILD